MRVHVEAGYKLFGRVLDPSLIESSKEHPRDLLGHRNRRSHREGHPDPNGLPDPALHKLMVEQERPLERGGWALERMTEDRHVDRARVEAGENLAQAVGPCERGILEAAFLEAWGGREVI